ncbi:MULTISPECIES: tyrosine-type recombinase/integrase [unclassified Thermosynechococcus]|uniref:tyrosine-type recombinase/integrase n=1 Tax=unclassified Thermosynechococcus TaxID=2622553 RepID=UPI0037DC0131
MKINRSGKAEPLSQEQFLQLFQELEQPYRTILAICWYTTERAGAVCQLKVDDCYHGDRTRDVIVIPGRIRKDRKTREVPISRRLKQILKEYRHCRSPWLFPSFFNPERPLRLQIYARNFKAACLRLGWVGYSTHSVRRGAITHLAKLGLNSRHIQALSGHSDLKLVQSYCDVLDQDLAAAVDLL